MSKIGIGDMKNIINISRFLQTNQICALLNNPTNIDQILNYDKNLSNTLLKFNKIYGKNSQTVVRDIINEYNMFAGRRDKKHESSKLHHLKQHHIDHIKRVGKKFVTDTVANVVKDPSTIEYLQNTKIDPSHVKKQIGRAIHNTIVDTVAEHTGIKISDCSPKEETANNDQKGGYDNYENQQLIDEINTIVDKEYYSLNSSDMLIY